MTRATEESQEEQAIQRMARRIERRVARSIFIRRVIRRARRVPVGIAVVCLRIKDFLFGFFVEAREIIDCKCDRSFGYKSLPFDKQRCPVHGVRPS